MDEHRRKTSEVKTKTRKERRREKELKRIYFCCCMCCPGACWWKQPVSICPAKWMMYLLWFHVAHSCSQWEWEFSVWQFDVHVRLRVYLFEQSIDRHQTDIEMIYLDHQSYYDTHSHIGRQSGPGTHKNNSENNENDFILRHHNVRCTLTDHTQTHTLFLLCTQEKQQYSKTCGFTLLFALLCLSLTVCVSAHVCLCVVHCTHEKCFSTKKLTTHQYVGGRQSVSLKIDSRESWRKIKKK